MLRSALERRLRDLGFKDAPGRPKDADGNGEVCSSSPDGRYFNIETGQTHPDIQILIVGAMRRTPIEYAGAVAGYWVKDVSFLPSASSVPAALRQIILERGFFSIILRSYAREDRPRAIIPLAA